MNNWQENSPPVKQLLMLKQRSRQRKMLRRLLLIGLSVTLLGLTLVLSACATPSPVPCDPLPPISKPVPDKSMPSVSYSLSVQTWLEQWRLKLMNGQTKP